MRYDLMQAKEYTDRDGQVKKRWIKLGSMWSMERGGFGLTFDALPTPSINNGVVEVRCVAFEPKKEDAPRQQEASRPQRNARRDDLDDDPF